MAASGRGLGRALHSSAGPAWKRAQSGAQGHLKPEYDAVVIGAGKAKKAVLREGGQSPAHRPLGTLQGALLWSQPVIRLVIHKSPTVWESVARGSGSTLGLLCAPEGSFRPE